MTEKVTSLIIGETVTGLIPLLYGLSFATAYYGPNGNLIGNVRNSWWSYDETEDVQRFYEVMFQMFAIDVCCILASGIILWIFGKINIAQELGGILKKYWSILMIKIAGSLLLFGLNDINGGMDFTLSFDWLTDEGRLRLVQNSSDLSA